MANRTPAVFLDRVPRKPTLIARKARERLAAMARGMDSGSKLPTLAVLSRELGIHPSTVFRILRDLAAEGIVWQSPNGRFHPAAARAERVKGLPVCFVGREIWQWSRLYQEMLSGVSEVCSSNGSSLVLLSVPGLIRQDTPTGSPKFAPPKTQRAELQKRLPLFPRHCGGILFDHLWSDAALALHEEMPTAPKIQLLHGTAKWMPVAAPNHEAAADMARDFIVKNRITRPILVSPFAKDPAIDFNIGLLADALAGHHPLTMQFDEACGRVARIARAAPGKRTGFICPEDNTAKALFEEIQSGENKDADVFLLATQGTGLLTAPANRLRFDFRRLGRSAAAAVLLGQVSKPPSPSLVGIDL